MSIPIIGDIIGAVKDIVSEVVVDKDKRDELSIRLQEIEDRADERLHEELMGQIAINQVEAGHRSIFVAGWRPFIGWVGGLALLWTFVLSKLIEQVFGVPAPTIDTTALIQVVMAILGLGAMRSFDKIKGVNNDVLKPTLPKVVKNMLPENAPWSK